MQMPKRYAKSPIMEAIIDLRVILPDTITARTIEHFHRELMEVSDEDLVEEIRQAILPTLLEIHDLLTWPDGWNGYNALAPQYAAVQYADHWIELFYKEIMESEQHWIEPNVTSSAEGEVVLEWWNKDKGLTIYIGNQSATFLKDWGADINTEMEEGYANSPNIRRVLWHWLVS